jgi:hypothetical protein
MTGTDCLPESLVEINILGMNGIAAAQETRRTYAALGGKSAAWTELIPIFHRLAGDPPGSPIKSRRAAM